MSSRFSGSLPLLSALFVFYYTDFMANKICMYVLKARFYSLPRKPRREQTPSLLSDNSVDVGLHARPTFIIIIVIIIIHYACVRLITCNRSSTVQLTVMNVCLNVTGLPQPLGLNRQSVTGLPTQLLQCVNQCLSVNKCLYINTLSLQRRLFAFLRSSRNNTLETLHQWQLQTSASPYTPYRGSAPGSVGDYRPPRSNPVATPNLLPPLAPTVAAQSRHCSTPLVATVVMETRSRFETNYKLSLNIRSPSTKNKQ